MSIARHGSGPTAVGAAYIAKVHPVFMLPPIAAAAFGAILAGALNPAAATIHGVAIFSAVYTAHLKDGYVDFYVRDEDADSPLTERGFWVGITAASAVMAGCLLALYLLVDIWAVLLTLPGWLIGYLHAPQLDTNPITATGGYPLGIALAIIGGYYVQVQSLSVEAVALAAVFLILLSGVKIVDDLQDHAWDAANQKRSAGVALGVARAHRIAMALMAAAMLLVVVCSAGAIVAPSSALAAVVFLPVVYLARQRDPRIGTMLLIRGSYLVLAVLIAAAWWRPLS